MNSLKYWLLLLILFTSCGNQETFQILNLDTAKKMIQNYYESGQFDKECAEAINVGIAEIEKLKLSKNSAVVFDIDETVLSNYEHTKELGFGYVYELYEQWLRQGNAKAIPETKRFYNWLVQKNIKVIFLTGRHAEDLASTKKNLLAEGFTNFDTLIVRSAQNKKIAAAEWKALERERLTKNGYVIIACIGDQWSDMVGGFTGIKIKLPNYLYIIE